MATAPSKVEGSDQENPLAEGLERLPVHPTILTIFGATGDLSKRKLLPALYNLAHEGALPERFNLIGSSRGEMSDDEFRDVAKESIEEFSRRKVDDKVLSALLEGARYVTGSFDDPEVYEQLDKITKELDEEAGIDFNRAYYLSTAPSFFPVIVEQLGEHGLDHHEGSDVRVVIEKPIGTNLKEAKELNAAVLDVLDEDQVFRIDHYLGKETVQNVLAFRFANGLFEPIWNRNYIDYVQITAAEDIGIGTRAGYYDKSGALRDLVQNHMLQLLTLLCMEPPVSFSADAVRDEKVKVLHAIDPPTPEQVEKMAVRAQYEAGVAAGEEVKGYLEEEDVPEDSSTETYAALRLDVDNWRWAGVPIYLRAGKRLARKVTEIAVLAQAGAPPGLRAGGVGGRAAQPDRAHDAAERGRLDLHRGEDPGHADAHPAGEHAVPVRHRVHVGVPRGLRAADHGRHARRRHAVHPRRRGGGAVDDRGPDPRGVGGPAGPDPQVRRRVHRTRRGRLDPRGRPQLESDLTGRGESEEGSPCR